MIKKALLIGFTWCLIMVIVNTLLLWLGIFKAVGYTPWVNPLGIFIITFPFFLLASILYQFLKSKKKWNKWLNASVSIVISYLTAISYRLLENDYYRTIDWKVSVFLFVQIALLVLFDALVSKFLNKKKI